MPATEKDSMYYLEKAPVGQAILHMAVPMIMGMVLNLVYSLIDTFFIGRLGNTAMLAAVTLAFPFQIVLMGVGQIFGTGGGTLIPRLLGEKNFAAAKTASAVNFYLALLAGVGLMLVLMPILSPLLSLMGATGEAFQYTRDYVLVFALGSPLIIAMLALAETIRGEGAATASMTGMLLSVGVNIILDPLFIFALKLNVMGAALATVTANGVAVVYFLWFIQTKSQVQSVSPKDFRPTADILANIFKVGLSPFLFSTLMIVSTLMFNTYALRYSDSVVAAFGIANNVVQICEFLGTGLFTGIVPLIAFAYAAGNQERLNAVLRTTTLAFVGITLALGLPMYLFRQPIFQLFSSDPLVLEAGFKILQAMLVSVMFTGFSEIITGMFQAFGMGLESNIMAVLRGLALIPLLFLGNRLFGLNGVIWALPSAEITASAVGMALWLASKGKIMSVTLDKRAQLVPALE
jgi:putative MATE family efflux protein